MAAGVPVLNPWWDRTLHAEGRVQQVFDAGVADALAKAAELIAH